MAAARKVLIVGAGIVGQTLACALARRGVACEIVEIKPDFEIAGAGMTLQGTALRAFLDIGIVEDMEAAGWHDPARPIVFLDTRGEVVLSPPERNMVGDGYPATLAIRRQAVHEVLNRHVAKAGVPIRMATTVERLDDVGTGVEAAFTDGTTGTYDLVVGADGIRSKVRTMLFGDVPPQFAGFCNWRMILPQPKSVDRMMWMWGHGKTVGILPVGDERIYVAGVGKAATPERPPQQTVPDTFRRKFACFGGPMPEILGLDITADDILYTIMEEVKLPPPWYRGRVLVLGDAAHAACPFWAQGAAMGIEDAIALAIELDATDDVDAAVAAWFERRYERARFVQEGSFATGQNLTRDEESDEPKLFPPPAREAIAKQGALQQARLAEPF